VEIGYSYKTNPLPGVLKILHRAGASAEVISHFELWLALKLGMPGTGLFSTGRPRPRRPSPSRVEPGQADQHRQYRRAADDHELAQTHGRRQRVGVRVVPSVGWPGSSASISDPAAPSLRFTASASSAT